MKLFDRQFGVGFDAFCRQLLMSAGLETGFNIEVSRVADADQQQYGNAIIADLDQE